MSLSTLDGSPCTAADGMAGTVDVVVDAGGTITLACMASTGGGGGGGGDDDPTPNWCEDNYPELVGPHVVASCDEFADAFAYTCETGWSDVNDNIADGCELPVYERLELDEATGAAIADWLLPTSSPDCHAWGMPGACPGSNVAFTTETVSVSLGSGNVHIAATAGAVGSVEWDTLESAEPVACRVDFSTLLGFSTNVEIEAWGILREHTGGWNYLEIHRVSVSDLDPEDWYVVNAPCADRYDTLQDFLLEAYSFLCGAPGTEVIMRCL